MLITVITQRTLKMSHNFREKFLCSGCTKAPITQEYPFLTVAWTSWSFLFQMYCMVLEKKKENSFSETTMGNWKLLCFLPFPGHLLNLLESCTNFSRRKDYSKFKFDIFTSPTGRLSQPDLIWFRKKIKPMWHLLNSGVVIENLYIHGVWDNFQDFWKFSYTA